MAAGLLRPYSRARSRDRLSRDSGYHLNSLRGIIGRLFCQDLEGRFAGDTVNGERTKEGWIGCCLHGARTIHAQVPNPVFLLFSQKEFAVASYQERANGVSHYKIFVVETFLDDHMNHGHGQGSIRCRTDRDPLVSLGCGGIEKRPDHNNLRPSLLRVKDEPHLRKVGLCRISTPDDDHLRMEKVLKPMALSRIPQGEQACGRNSHISEPMALGLKGSPRAPHIGESCRHQPSHEKPYVAAARRNHFNGLRTVFLLHRQELLRRWCRRPRPR